MKTNTIPPPIPLAESIGLVPQVERAPGDRVPGGPSAPQRGPHQGKVRMHRRRQSKGQPFSYVHMYP